MTHGHGEAWTINARSRQSGTHKEVAMLPATRRRVLPRWSDPFDLMPMAFSRMLQPWLPQTDADLLGEYPVDISEDNENLYVEAEAPGFKKNEINVTLDGPELRIVAEREERQPKGTRRLHERRYQRIERTFTLPATVDPNSVEARLEDGVLRLKMHKSTTPEQKHIEIT
jgi:HSP20 family protein